MQGHWILGGGEVCGVLYRLNGGDCLLPDVFVSPTADPAPWYDPDEPGAATFLGVILTDITGYDSTISRPYDERIGGLGGAVFGGQVRKPRTWTFKAGMVSADDAGAEFGLRWLTDVALVDGPHETEVWAPKPGMLNDAMIGCRDLVGVEWTMVAGNPYLYKRPAVCLDAEIVGAFATCNDICDYLFGDPGTPHCCTVTPPDKGVVAPIFTFSSVSGMNTLLLEAWPTCPDATAPAADPVLQMQLSGIPAGATVVVDCAQRTITVTEPDPSTGTLVESDGSYLIELPDGRSLEWLQAASCDDVGCFCARTAHPCSQGGDTTVQIETQVREG
jgi:hypothetical protein